jgi:hypothetical protein
MEQPRGAHDQNLDPAIVETLETHLTRREEELSHVDH